MLAAIDAGNTEVRGYLSVDDENADDASITMDRHVKDWTISAACDVGEGCLAIVFGCGRQAPDDSIILARACVRACVRALLDIILVGHSRRHSIC